MNEWMTGVGPTGDVGGTQFRRHRCSVHHLLSLGPQPHVVVCVTVTNGRP